MGSDSDFPVVRKAAEALKEFGILFEMRVLSAHRSPKEVAEFAQNAAQTVSELSSQQRAWRLTSREQSQATLPCR